ncbi:MAG TPA: glycosyltransferase family 1 protein [Kiritimatiellia bacterium]|nr:glycosyltransferase family 1 protein [Kiritimatiellia bacterium]HRZ13395.1 glycosyltransferase family 1 protein [Kiritimatiellia bacterium]HSA18965.1 glycosyltransferase family 1 protein [Kiritimatiellia bacterium]
MRIGLDARWIFPELSGIGTYTTELIREFARLETGHEFVLFFRDPAIRDRVWRVAGLDGHPRFRAQMIPWGVFSPWSQLRLPAVLRRLALDVFHSPNYMIPFRAFPRGRAHAVQCVATVHDLIPLLFPEHTPRALKTRLFPLFRRVMFEVGARADAILTVSEASRADILRSLRIPGEREARVRVVYNGVAPEYRPALRRPAPHKTILYVGRFDPYKNVEGLLEAFARLRSRGGPAARLKIVGAPDPRYPEAPRRARELGLEGLVEWAGYTGGADLVDAYQQADVFVLLSRYEGFGLTLLEAMACGAPAVCSNIGALREVAGEAALFVDGADPEAAADALGRVLEDRGVAAELSRKGLARAREFTWARAAAEILRVYEEVARS